jgi:hypothetical protein
MVPIYKTARHHITEARLVQVRTYGGQTVTETGFYLLDLISLLSPSLNQFYIIINSNITDAMQS